MSIVYPLAMPALPGPRGVTMAANFVVAQSVSPFTMQQQVYEHPGSYWSLDFDLPIMPRPQAEVWIAWLLSLNGRSGSFLFGDPAGTAPLGTAGGSPIVNGAGQTGKTLLISGLTGVLKAGDYFSIGSGLTQRLYKNLTDQGPGGVTLDIFPRLRESPANAAPLTLINAQGVFALGDGTSGSSGTANQTLWSIDNAKLYGLKFSAMERF